MKTHGNILYRLARFLAGVPPEALGAMVLFALQHPGIIALLVAAVLFVLKYVVAAVLFALKYVVVLIIDAFVTWYLGKMFAIHLWPKLPRRLRRLLRKLEARVRLKPPGPDRPSRDGESAFSRNSKRHPHW
jgi:hypothetical protein